MKNNYQPAPIDTTRVILPEELTGLTEEMACHVHEIWAAGRVREGWTYGPERNDRLKTHPGLVPYEELSDAEQEYDRQTVVQTLKLILKLGFEIRKK